jgi:hypothetical protein
MKYFILGTSFTGEHFVCTIHTVYIVCLPMYIVCVYKHGIATAFAQKPDSS